MENTINIKKLAKKETKAKVTTYAIIVGTILIAYTLSMMFVVGWGFMNSFKSFSEFTDYPLSFPDFSVFGDEPIYDGLVPFFANYQLFFRDVEASWAVNFYTAFSSEATYYSGSVSGFNAILYMLWNSVQTVAAGTLLPIYLCCIMGYLTANYKYKFSRFIYALVMFTMIVPIVGTGSSMLNLHMSLGIYDNMLGFFIWNCQFTSMYFLIMFAFFEGLSSTYFEAAEIDGASQLKLIISIAIPMANTMIWAGIVSLFITTWNDYLTPLTYLPSHPTLAYGIWYFSRGDQRFKTMIPPQLAASFVLAIPSVVFFVVFRKKLMGNISIGGIKG